MPFVNVDNFTRVKKLIFPRVKIDLAPRAVVDLAAQSLCRTQQSGVSRCLPAVQLQLPAPHRAVYRHGQKRTHSCAYISATTSPASGCKAICESCIFTSRRRCRIIAKYMCRFSCNISCNTHWQWHCNICNFRSYMDMETFKLTSTTNVGTTAGEQMRCRPSACAHGGPGSSIT